MAATGIHRIVSPAFTRGNRIPTSRRGDIAGAKSIETAGHSKNQAFTLVELLVVITIIGILAALLLPVLNNVRSRAQSASCLNNVSQLVMASILYADDYNSRYPLNLRASMGATVNGAATGSWVNGSQKASFPTQMTSTANLTTSPASTPPLLGSYTRSPGVYKCPSDSRTAVVGGESLPATRSYALNGFFGAAPGDPYTLTDYKVFLKEGDLFTPSDVFTFIDEAPFSIDDGFFAWCDNSGPDDGVYNEFAADYHNLSSGVAFADGHSETHKWQDGYVVPPGTTVVPVPAVTSTNDFNWMRNRGGIRTSSELPVFPTTAP